MLRLLHAPSPSAFMRIFSCLLHSFPRFLPASSHAATGYKRLHVLAIATTASSNPFIRLHENMPRRLGITYAMLSRTGGDKAPPPSHPPPSADFPEFDEFFFDDDDVIEEDPSSWS
jgi:hypothetical protein